MCDVAFSNKENSLHLIGSHQFFVLQWVGKNSSMLQFGCPDLHFAITAQISFHSHNHTRVNTGEAHKKVLERLLYFSTVMTVFMQHFHLFILGRVLKAVKKKLIK